MIPYHHFADMAFNTPLAMLAEAAIPAVHFLLGRMRGEIGPTPRAQDRFDDAHEDRGSARASVLPTPVAGVGVIRVVGKLVNRGAWIGSSSGLVSYEGIKAQCAAGENDDTIHTVVIDFDTAGGEVLGCFDCSSAIRRLRAKKRVIAFVGGRACSAGYDLAASATEIVATRESVVASVGVFAIHLNVKEALEKEGIEPTIVYSGAHKVDANPYEKLPPAVRARLQAEIDGAREMFIDSVVSGRPQLTVAAVRATEALTYRADAALKLGLIDRIASFEEVLAEASAPRMRRELTFITATNQEGTMRADETNTNTCATCGAGGCGCGATCTEKGCGCCDACKATVAAPGAPADDAKRAAAAQETSFFATMRNFFLGAPAAAAPDPEKVALLEQLATERTARVNAEVGAILARNASKLGRDAKTSAEKLLRAAMTDPAVCAKTLAAELTAFIDSLPGAVNGSRIARNGDPDAAADAAIDRTTSTIVGEEDGNESRLLDRDVRQYMRDNKIEYSAKNYRAALSAVLAKSSAPAT